MSTTGKLGRTLVTIAAAITGAAVLTISVPYRFHHGEDLRGVFDTIVGLGMFVVVWNRVRD